MKILVIGSGGREHAIAFKCAQSPLCTKVYVAPGNAGTHREPNVENLQIDVMDFAALAEFAVSEKIEFTIVGPEAPLVHGIVDYFNERNLAIFGPSQQAAQLEGSKTFAKKFMQAHGIPTAQAHDFEDLTLALGYLEQCQFPIVIKADGLAAGKGVVIAKDLAEAKSAVESMLAHKKFADASQKILIENFIEGTEASFIALCDGEHAVALASSQDHKARDDGDKGPNTGGMGAYSPAPIIDDHLHEEIMQNVILPTLKGMKAAGHPFKGFLYAGLMIRSDESFEVLEFNTRFGDPETQAILLRLRSDLIQTIKAALDEKLDTVQLEWDRRYALGVVLAAQGYPAEYIKGDNLNHLMDIKPSENYKIFHAGTIMDKGAILTAGGRVICVTALGNTLQEAHDRAYNVVKKAKWDNCFYRTDIGHKALT